MPHPPINKSRLPIKKIILLGLFLGGAFFIYKTFFAGHAPGGGMMGMPGGPMPVSVAEVIKQDVQQWQEFSGKLVAVDGAEIRPQVSGVIEKVHFTGGEHVRKGQILFTIDQRPYKAALEAAEAQYTAASAEHGRAEKLLKEKAIPQREYDERRSAAKMAQAELTRAKLNMDYSQVKAPIAGRISRPEITAGNLVETNTGAPLLTTIVSDDPIYADFEIDEGSYLTYLENVGDAKMTDVPVNLGLMGEEGTPHAGHVQSFDNQLNPTTGTLRVRAVFDNDGGKLIPGLFARITLGKPGDTNALLITDRAIGTDQNKKFVLVVGEDNKAMYREVKLGGMANGLRVVREGLSVGEKIIVDGLQRVQPGMPVVPEVVPMEGKDSGSSIQDAGKNTSPEALPSDKVDSK